MNSYKEIILSIVMGIWEGFFSIGGGAGLVYRGILGVLDYPFAVGMGSMAIYALIVRIIGIVMYRKAGLIHRKKALLFLPVSLIGGYLGSNFVLHSSNILLYISMGGFLLVSGCIHFLPKRFTPSYDFTIPSKSIKYLIGYVIMIISDIITTVVGGAGIITTHILKHFFDIKPLEAAGMRKVFMMGRSITVITTYYLAGTYDIKLTMMLIIIGVPSFILGTKYVLKQGDSFAEYIIGYMSIGFGLFMLYKGIYRL